MIKKIKIKRKRIKKRPRPVKTPTLPQQNGVIQPLIIPKINPNTPQVRLHGT